MQHHLTRLAPTMRAQCGLVTIRQIRRAGADSWLPRRLLDRGVWRRYERGVYGPVGLPDTWERGLMSLILAAGGSCVASHRAAARLLGVPGFSQAPIEVTIERFRTLRRPGIIVHESTDLHLAGRTSRDGIPCTDRPRLAVDLGAVVSRRRYENALQHLRHADGVTMDQLVRAYLRHKSRGRNGTGPLREYIDRYSPVGGVPESTLEVIALDLLLDAGLPVPTLQHEVLGFRLDIAFVRERVAVEIDGAHHADRVVAERDRRRDEVLRRAGWRIIRITRAQLMGSPELLVQLVREALGC